MRTTAEETRRNDRRIIEAAIRIFSEKGYDAASMQDIADAVQISRGPLYYRYKTKKEIFFAAMEVYAAQELEEHQRILEQRKPFPEKIRAYLYYATRDLRDGRPAFPMEIYSTPEMEDVNIRVRQVYAQGYVLLQNAVRQAIEDREIRQDTDVEHLVNLLFIAFDGLRYSRLKSGILTSPEKVEAAIDHMCLLVRAGYCGT